MDCDRGKWPTSVNDSVQGPFDDSTRQTAAFQPIAGRRRALLEFGGLDRQRRTEFLVLGGLVLLTSDVGLLLGDGLESGHRQLGQISSLQLQLHLWLSGGCCSNLVWFVLLHQNDRLR